MSDTYTVEDYMRETGRQARSVTIGSMDDNPDDAARAMELGDASGIAPTAIYGDLDSFEKTYKSALSAQLIQNNPKLADWLVSHPMAPKVAHDDLGALDATSQALKDFPGKSQLAQMVDSDINQKQQSESGDLGPFYQTSFGRGFGEQPIGSSVLSRPGEVEWALAHPEMAAVGMTLATPMELLSRTTSGLISMGHDGLEKVFGTKLANEAAAMAEWAMMRGDLGVKGAGGGVEGPLARMEQNTKLADTMRDTASALSLTDPWTRIDREPPPGLHPLIDEAKKLQSKDDLDALDNALKEATQSATRERAPDLFADFIRSHTGDREIGIAPEAVRELYGDKVPHRDDNLLGWVDGLGDRLASAELTGQDVRIPLADWLARVEPDVAKQLHDDIRVRDDGLTANERKIEAEAKQVGEEPHQQIRGAAGLEPMAMAGDRFVQLKRKPEKESESITSGAKFHDIDMLDENGNTIGSINISEQKGGKQLYVDMIQAGDKEHKFYQPNFLGPALIRDIGRQLKEMFPQAFDKANGGEGITGHRVSGAREQAGTWEAKHAMPKVLFDLGENPQAFRDVLQPFWEPISQAVEVLRGDFGDKARPLAEAIESELERMVPSASREVVHSIYYPRAGGEVRGLYQPDFGKIFVALDKAGVGVARHEGIHALRRLDFIREDEWKDLLAESKAQGWRERFGIDKTYHAFSDEIKDEEAIAEAYRYWRDGEDILKDPGVFERIKDFIETLHRRIKEILGRDFTWEEIFKEIDSGRVGRREVESGVEGGAEGLASVGDEEGFGIYDRAKSLGVTQAHLDRMQKLIEKRNSEDLEASQRRAEVRQRRRSNKEYKERRTTLRDEVREDLESRPDIALDQFITQNKIKINPEALTEDQKLRLPKDYLQKKDGVNPDDIAGYFGYTSGDALVERLGMLTEDRRRSGMSGRDYLNRLIDVETDRRLNREFGDREQNILEEAKDQALSETQLNLVHEETLAYALKAGVEPQFGKDEVRSMVRQVFNDTPTSQISSDRLLQTAGKIGKKIEEAGSKGKWDEAYRLSQQRNHAVIAAKMARDFEKDKRALDRTAKTFRKREVPSVPAEYTNWIHDILTRVGYGINRSVQDLAENIGRQESKTLEDFVDQKQKEWMGLKELPVADFLKDPGFRKQVKDLTYSEFMGLKNSVDTLVKAGRDEKKIYAEGETRDREELLNEFTDKLKTFGYKASNVKPGMVGQWPRLVVYGMTAKETTWNRWDRGDPLGSFNKFLSYPLAAAANGKRTLQRTIAEAFGKLSKPENLDKLVDAPFADPLDPQGGPWKGFKRSNVLQMLNHAGNEGNWKVLARGYGAEPEALMQWLVKNTTKEDWDRAQQAGDTIYKKLIGMADGVYERMTGATIEKIRLDPIDNVHGKYEGWYHPLEADPDRKTVSVQNPDTGEWVQKAGGKRETINDNDYFHFTTSNGYTRKRTGAIYPLNLEFNMVPTRINQMIHDINYKEPIHEAQKILLDPRFKENVTKYYGKEYADGLAPYLRKLAGGSSIDSKNVATAIKVSNFFRQNVIGTYIGFNPYTMGKHGPTALVMSMREVGASNFAEAVKDLFVRSPDIRKDAADFMKEHAEEVNRRDRNWQDTVSNQNNILTGASNARDKMAQIASAGVAWSDMVSAKPTWWAEYNKRVAEGLTVGQSVSLAERAVRRAHGSTAETNLPPMVAGSGDVLHPWLTSVYGFFGTAMQRRIEMFQKMNDTHQLISEREFQAASKKAWSAFGDFMTYMVWPTIVEEFITGIGTDDHRGLGQRIISGATMGAASSVLYLRDIIHGLVAGHEPGVGLASSAMHDMANAAKVFMHPQKSFTRDHAAKSIGDLLTFTGEATGMMPKMVGNAVRYGTSVMQGQEKPKTPADILLGTTRGTQKRRQEK